MDAWERLTPLLGAYEMRVLLALLVCACVFRLLVPGADRRRGTAAIAVFVASVIVHVLPGAGEGPLALLGSILTAMGAVLLAGIVLFDLGLARANLRIPSVVRDLMQAAVLLVVLLILLRQAGVNLVSLLTTSAVVTAVIGFALQNTIANVIAGIALQVDETLRIGDWIRVGEREGRISEVRWRSTSLTTDEGSTIIVPSSELVNTEVTNFSRPLGKRRIAITVGFHYRHPPNEVSRVLLEAIRGMPDILEDPAPDCITGEFADSAVHYVLRFWVVRLGDDEEVAGMVRTRVWYAARRAGLEIPYPVRTLARETRGVSADELEDRDAAVAQVSLFARLDDADRRTLAETMRVALFAAGEEIIREGDPGDSLYVVQRGTVEVGSGRERHRVATLGPGQVFGEMSLMTGEARAATCTATSEVACYVIDNRPMRRLLGTKPHLAEELAALLAPRQGELADVRDRASVALARDDSSQLLRRIRQFFNLG